MEVLITVASWIGMFFFFLVMALSILSILVGLPGAWVILLEAIIYGLITGWDQGIGGWDLLSLLLLAASGEAIEFVVTAYGAQKYGASNKAIAAALVGGLAGAILVSAILPFLPVIAALIGAFLGVYLGAFAITWYYERDLAKARRSGLGAFIGRMGAALAKGSIGVTMAAIIITEIF